MLLARYLAANIGGSHFDDRMYTPGRVVYMDGSGAPASPQGALRVATVWRAVNVVAAAVACLPIDVFTPILGKDGHTIGKQPALKDPLRRKLRRKPNVAQTSYRWRHHMVGQAVLGGNYYAQKVGKTFPDGTPEQIWPLDPERMKVQDVASDGTIRYEYTLKNGRPQPFTTPELVHVRGFSWDGITGVSILDMMRDNTSLALSNRRQRASFVRNEMRPSVVATHKGQLSDKGRENFRKGLKRAFGGPDKAGEVLVLEEGMALTPFQITSRDAQWIEGENFNVEEFLRFIGVPGVLVGHGDKTATYASAESFFQSFATHSVWPWVENIEGELTTSLYDAPDDERFVEMNLDALLRADSTARGHFYRVLVELGIYTRNEIRELENRNPLPGLDEPLTPLNMGGGPLPVVPEGQPQPQQAAPKKPMGPPPAQQDGGGQALAARLDRARAVVREAARRVVSKEKAALAGTAGHKGIAERFAADAKGWRRSVQEFYDDHAALVMEVLCVSEEDARRYCYAQAAAIVAGGLAVLADREEQRLAALERLALME